MRDRDRLDAQLLRYLDGALGDREREAVLQRLRDDDAAVRRLSQLALRAQQLSELGGQLAARDDAPGIAVARRGLRRAVVGLAAALLLAATVALLWSRRQGPQPPPTPGPRLAAGWQLTPFDASYTILDARRIRLTRGELQLTSRGANAGPLVIETPAGEARATGTMFFVGSYREPRTPGDPTMPRTLRDLTRVLVLAGLVTLANTHGQLAGSAGELLASDLDGPPRRMGQAGADMGTDLYKRLIPSQAGSNVIISPYSLSSALLMTYEGARGRTREQMAAALRVPRREGTSKLLWENARVHAAMGKINADLTADGDKRPYQLAVANALWAEQTERIRPEFTQALAGPYGAGLIPVDFIKAHEAARQRINGWVAERTQQRIKNLIPANGVSGSTRLVLTNAIYFKASWKWTFDVKKTRDGRFKRLDGTVVTAPMMQLNQKLRYASVSDDTVGPVQLLELPYGGEGLSMLLIVPVATDGLPRIEAALSSQALNEWTARLKPRKVHLKLPRFKIASPLYEVGGVLQAMGMTDAFDSKLADFSGIASRGLFISKVFHKGFIEVNEQGTEAAAATAVVMERGGGGPPVVRADRPFLFAIRHNASGSVLFLGRVMDPSDR